VNGVNNPPPDSARPRRALVLAGGGARGAYTFGCLLAFRKRRIEFDAVSGTSAGALNAILWASGSVGAGARLWKRLSFGTTYPPRLLRPPTPAPLIWLFGVGFVLLQLLRATIARRPNPLASGLSRLVGLAVGAGFLFFVMYMLDLDWGDFSVLPVIFFAGAFAFLIVSYLVEQKVSGQRFIREAVLASGMYVGIAKAVALVEDLGLTGVAHFFAKVFGGLLGFVLGAAAALGAIELWRVAVGRFEIKMDAHSVFSSGPLRSAIEKIVSQRPLQCPTYLTTASAKEVFMPKDELDWYEPQDDEAEPGHEDDDGAEDAAAEMRAPETATVWVPQYWQVSGLPAPDIVDLALASAALPFGLAPGVEYQGQTRVDGGVADNVPWFPFVAEAFDEVYVVLLEHFPSDAAAISELKINGAGWVGKMRVIEAALRGIPRWTPKKSIRSVNARYAPYIHPPSAFPRVFIFRPEKSLGGFIRGTLNFRGAYAKKLIRQGFAETLRKMDRSSSDWNELVQALAKVHDVQR